jgi:hypothetical protein
MLLTIFGCMCVSVYVQLTDLLSGENNVTTYLTTVLRLTPEAVNNLLAASVHLNAVSHLYTDL